MPGGVFLYFKNVVVNGALSIQDGGTAPTAGITTTGWTVAKTAVGNFSLTAVGSERAATAFSTTDALGTPSFSAASCWRSEVPYTGNFSNADWTFAFKLRAVSIAASQAGRVKIRLWKSANATGVGATQLTSSVLVGSTTAALTTSTSATSTATWTAPGIQSFNNEYFWVQCEWEITTVSSNNSGDVLFYIESTARISTPAFAVPPVYAQSHFRFRTDAGFVDAAPTWAEPEDVSIPSGDYSAINYRLRISVQNTGAGGPFNTWTLRYSKNGGAYTAITTTSSVVQAVDAGAGSTGDLATIQRLTSAAGTFSGNGNYNESGTTGNVIIGSGGFAEFEYGIKVVAADVAANDTIDFQIWPDTTGAITQTVTPRITVGVVAGAAAAAAFGSSAVAATGGSVLAGAGAAGGTAVIAAVGGARSDAAAVATGTCTAIASAGILSAGRAVATGTGAAAAAGTGSAAASGAATGVATAGATSSVGVLAAAAAASPGTANVGAIGASFAVADAVSTGTGTTAATSEAGAPGSVANTAGSSTTVAEGAAIAAADVNAAGTSTAAALSPADVPPIVILLPGGRATLEWRRIVAARGHAGGTSICRATGRAFVAANGNAAGAGGAAAIGLARRILHDDEIMILLEAA